MRSKKCLKVHRKFWPFTAAVEFFFHSFIDENNLWKIRLKLCHRKDIVITGYLPCYCCNLCANCCNNIFEYFLIAFIPSNVIQIGSKNNDFFKNNRIVAIKGSTANCPNLKINIRSVIKK